MRDRFTAPEAAALAGALALILATASAFANDGRDRYAQTHATLLYHLNAPVAPGAGFRILPEDMPGGADGDPAYRWAQSHASAVVQVAAYRTVRALGPAPVNMAIFDLSSENGDTPVDLGRPSATDPKGRWEQPSGRHPGGSHDGGLNLDLGYYMTSVVGKHQPEDYAACTEHYAAAQASPQASPQYAGANPSTTQEPRDAYMCTGPADRLDLGRQSYFLLQLLKLHRDQFGGRLLDEVGIDREILAAVRKRLATWNERNQHGVTAANLRDLDEIMTCDRWGGWQRFHHHHIHLRIQDFSPTGKLRDATLAIEREARRIRAALIGKSQSGAPVALDAQLLSYRMGRAIEAHALAARPNVPGISQVRYRMNGGDWQPPDNPRDDFRYIFDLPRGLVPSERYAHIEAEIVTSDGRKRVVSANVMLPRQDQRLFVAHRPGDIKGSATIDRRGRRLRAQVSFPEVLRPLVTSARYYLYPSGGGEPEVHVVEADWFASRAGRQRVSRASSRRRSGRNDLRLTLTRDRDAPALGLIEARVVLSRRYAVRVPLHVDPRPPLAATPPRPATGTKAGGDGPAPK